MQQCFPLLIGSRTTKADLMRLDRFLANQKHVLVFALEAALKLVRHIARHGADNLLRFQKCVLEFCCLTVANA